MKDTKNALYEFKKHWNRLINNTPDGETINLTKDQARCIYMFIDAFEPTWENLSDEIEDNPEFKELLLDNYEKVWGKRTYSDGEQIDAECLLLATSDYGENIISEYFEDYCLAYTYSERKAEELYEFRKKTGWVRYRQGIKKYGEKNEWEY